VTGRGYFRRVFDWDLRTGALVRSDQSGSLTKRITAVYADVVVTEGLESHRVTRIKRSSMTRYEVFVPEDGVFLRVPHEPKSRAAA